MGNLFQYIERAGSRSPGTMHFGVHDEGNATMQFIETADRITEQIVELLGNVSYHTGSTSDVRLIRTPPIAHPITPWIYAHRMDLQGFGIDASGSSNNQIKTTLEEHNEGKYQITNPDPAGFLEVPTFDKFADYPLFDTTVGFTQRPYVLCQDNNIKNYSNLNWYKPGIGDTTGTAIVYADEWLRWTEYAIAPNKQYLTAQQGQFVLNAPGVNVNGVPLSNAPAGNGQIKMIYPAGKVHYKWYQVPSAYVDDDSSYIFSLCGTVNQYKFDGFNPGTLLYSTMPIINRYVQPVPGQGNEFGHGGADLSSDTTIYANTKLVDIEFVFDYLEPTLGVLPTGAATIPGQAGTYWMSDDYNKVCYGHNLVPYAGTQQWYYASTANLGTTAFNNQPIYPSAPFQLLWSKPPGI